MKRILFLLSFVCFVVSGNAQFWRNMFKAAAVQFCRQTIEKKQDLFHFDEPNPNTNVKARLSSAESNRTLQGLMLSDKASSISSNGVRQRKGNNVNLVTTDSVVFSKGKQETQNEKVLNRFLSYVKIESQSVDTPDFTAFPMTKGQEEMALFLADEVRSFGGKNVEVTVSKDFYVYVKIPSNLSASKNKTVPSLFFTAHLDVTPEAPGKGITPIVHFDYQGGDLTLSPGIVLSPSSPAGSRLNRVC